MAEREKQKRAPRDESPDADRETDGNGGDGEEEIAVDEQELASYLQERIKPGLNRGAIPLLARSIAREIASDSYHQDSDQERGEQDADEQATDLESDLHTLQQRLGDDWTLYYGVHGGEAWLTAESQDVTQRVEAPDAEVLVKAVELLSKGGGRSGGRRSQAEDEEDGD